MDQFFFSGGVDAFLAGALYAPPLHHSPAADPTPLHPVGSRRVAAPAAHVLAPPRLIVLPSSLPAKLTLPACAAEVVTVGTSVEVPRLLNNGELAPDTAEVRELDDGEIAVLELDDCSVCHPVLAVELPAVELPAEDTELPAAEIPAVLLDEMTADVIAEMPAMLPAEMPAPNYQEYCALCLVSPVIGEVLAVTPHSGQRRVDHWVNKAPNLGAFGSSDSPPAPGWDSPGKCLVSPLIGELVVSPHSGQRRVDHWINKAPDLVALTLSNGSVSAVSATGRDTHGKCLFSQLLGEIAVTPHSGQRRVDHWVSKAPNLALDHWPKPSLPPPDCGQSMQCLVPPMLSS
ncbi:MAG: hypothetical protein ACKO3V_08980, partial [Pirellula sp.]